MDKKDFQKKAIDEKYDREGQEEHPKEKKYDEEGGKKCSKCGQAIK